MSRPRIRHRAFRGALLVVLSSTAAVGLSASGALAGGSTRSASLGLRSPTAIVSDGHHLWIANLAGNSVTETTDQGRLIRTIRSQSDGFQQPDAITAAGGHVFVVNRRGSVTELDAADGSLVRVIAGHRYDFGRPVALVAAAGDVWVVDSGTNAVTEFRQSDGALIRVIDPHNNYSAGLDDPVAITAAGPDLWVLSATRPHSTSDLASLTELVASTGAVRRTVHGSALGLHGSRGVAFDGTHLWVSDSVTDAVTELRADGALVQVITNSSLNQNYGFDAPTLVASAGGHVYVISPPGASPMVTQIQPSNGHGHWFECNTNDPDPHFANPTGLAVQGSHVWVVSPANDSLAELQVSTGTYLG